MGDKLYSEAKTNGDLVHDNFKESYLNLTVKTLRMLKWVGQHCDNVRYLVKLDDDVYLNVPKLLGFLHDIVANRFTEKDSKNLIAGFKYNNIKIDSDPTSKWYTPPSLFETYMRNSTTHLSLWPPNPKIDRFPDFVSGICYVLGSRARKDLYLHALSTPLFHLEDVFLTGIVRARHLGLLDVVDIPGMHVTWVFHNKMYMFPCDIVHYVVAAHALTANQIGCYNKLQDYCERGYASWFPILLLCY